MRTLLIFLVCAVWTASIHAQSLTLEGGAAAVPSLLPSWTLGASLQIPIIDRFSIGVNYYRWAENQDRLEVIAKNPPIPQNDPRYDPTKTFPGFRGTFWGNYVTNIYAGYRFIQSENLAVEFGLGYALLEKRVLNADAAFPHAIFFYDLFST